MGTKKNLDHKKTGKLNPSSLLMLLYAVGIALVIIYANVKNLL